MSTTWKPTSILLSQARGFRPAALGQLQRPPIGSRPTVRVLESFVPMTAPPPAFARLFGARPRDTPWEVDLGQSYKIEEVLLWNRTEAGQDRWHGVRVQLLDERRNVVWKQTRQTLPLPKRIETLNEETIPEPAR